MQRNRQSRGRRRNLFEIEPTATDAPINVSTSPSYKAALLAGQNQAETHDDTHTQNEETKIPTTAPRNIPPRSSPFNQTFPTQTQHSNKKTKGRTHIKDLIGSPLVATPEQRIIQRPQTEQSASPPKPNLATDEWRNQYSLWQGPASPFFNTTPPTARASPKRHNAAPVIAKMLFGDDADEQQGKGAAEDKVSEDPTTNVVSSLINNIFLQ